MLLKISILCFKSWKGIKTIKERKATGLLLQTVCGAYQE